MFKGEIEYRSPYYSWKHSEPGISVERYEKFVNWVSGEYDLLLQDETDGLIVFSPNGWVSINNAPDTGGQINLMLTVNHKSKKESDKIISELCEIYRHVLRIMEKPVMIAK